MTDLPTSLSADERKKILVLQGQLFRANLMLARHDVSTSLQPVALLRNVMSTAASSGAGAAREWLRLQSLLDGRLGLLLPIASQAWRLLARGRNKRMLLSGSLALLAGTGAWAGWTFMQRRRARQEEAKAGSPPAEAGAEQA